MIITIDGPSGTGKSSTARGMAKELSFVHVDTGAMYRAFAHFILQRGIDPQKASIVIEQIPHFKFRIEQKSERKKYWIGEEEVTEAIRTQPVTEASAVVALYPEVRQAIMARQQAIGASTDAVFEGRDLGTVVFPDATFKVFLTARPEIRARRRCAELLARQPDRFISVDEVLQQQTRRDAHDCTRKHSPLKPAADAYILDTSDMELEAVIAHLVNKLRERIG